MLVHVHGLLHIGGGKGMITGHRKKERKRQKDRKMMLSKHMNMKCHSCQDSNTK
jgi:hypothetical protein